MGGGGGTQMIITIANPEVPYGRGPALGGFDALSCYLSLIFKLIQKWDLKNSRLILEGGGGGCCASL